MRKIKLEKITGLVALSYLILIPVGTYYGWRKLQAMDNDVTTMWDKLGLSSEQASPTFSFTSLFKGSRVR